jgi:hypothetical protein
VAGKRVKAFKRRDGRFNSEDIEGFQSEEMDYDQEVDEPTSDSD